MIQTNELTAIEAEVLDGYLVVPKGLTPVYAHTIGTRMIVHVENWTAAKEYDQNYFDLYALSETPSHILHFKMSGVDRGDEQWYSKFGLPTKEAMLHNGELVIRDRV